MGLCVNTTNVTLHYDKQVIVLERLTLTGWYRDGTRMLFDESIGPPRLKFYRGIFLTI